MCRLFPVELKLNPEGLGTLAAELKLNPEGLGTLPVTFAWNALEFAQEWIYSPVMGVVSSCPLRVASIVWQPRPGA